MDVFIVAFFIALPFLLVYGAYQFHLIKEGKAFYFNRLKWHTKISRKRYMEMDAILTNRISFYRHLSDDGKAKFIHRLNKLLLLKKFVARKNIVITEEMKIVACAAIVQITFGLNKYELDNVKGFIIYPSIFYNSFMKLHLKGSTPPEGMISLSWKDLEHGFLVENDRYNLGLHEVAHALKLSLKHAYHFDVTFASYLKKWETIGYREFNRMNRGNESFLRKYGGVNEHEFFAVCIEHFFEVPEQFQYNLPKIFYHLSILLNLDPLNTRQDYIIVKG